MNRLLAVLLASLPVAALYVLLASESNWWQGLLAIAAIGVGAAAVAACIIGAMELWERD